MGQEASIPVSRAGNGLSRRRISRQLRGRMGSGDDDGGPHTQEELETTTPDPNGCVSPGHPHMGHDPHLIQGHSLVRAHDPQPEQAPPSTETGQTTGCNRPTTPDRVGSPSVEDLTKAAAAPKGEASQGAGTTGQTEPAEAAMAQVSTPSACPGRCPTTPESARGSAQSLQQHREHVLDSAGASSPGPDPSSTPVAPIAHMESLQSALANANANSASHSDPATRNLSSSALPSVAQSSGPSISRPLSLGTTMIVQGLVQTIEVTRAPARNTPPVTTNDGQPVVEETTSLEKDKGKRRELGETNGEDISAPLASGSSPPGTSTSISNTSAQNTPDTLSNNNTPATSSITTDTNDTPASNDTPSTPSQLGPTATSPVTSSRPSSSPSSTDVLGLLLSIAAQATAEALVPWSVPPRSRTAPREGIAGGLAAAFNALTSTGAGAAGEAGASSAPQTATTVLPESTPTPHIEPIIRPPTPPPPLVEFAPEPQPSSRRFSRRFSGLSLSPGRIPSFSSRRLSSFISGRRTESIRREATETGRRASSPAPRRAPSPTPRRASTPVPKPPRRGVLGRIERWVPRRLRRENEAGPSRQRNESFARSRSPSPADLTNDSPIVATPRAESPRANTPLGTSPLDESVDFGRAPPPPTLSVPAPTFPEPSVSPLPSPPILVPASEPPTISVPTPSISTPVSPVSSHPTSPISTLPTSPTSAHPTSPIPSIPNLPTPTTDAEELIRFSQMLGFTPGVIHPPGTFERFLSDMQDELRATLGEYQGRVRGRGEGSGTGGNVAGGAEGNAHAVEGDVTGGAGIAPVEDPSQMASLLDHRRPHVPSTDPLPLNWWRMYRFPALPDGAASSAGSTLPGEVTTSQSEAGTSTETTATSPAEPTETSPTPNDAEPQQPIHPAIIIGLRSLARDPTEESTDSEGRAGEPRDRVRSSESGNRTRTRSSETGDRTRSSESAERVRSLGSEQRVRRRLRLGEEERRSRDGTRNYMIWIIGGYYPSNHPILVHPNLFLGQVHPDELWMLNEFLGQVKSPTASKDDIAKAGLRVVKGAEIKELAKTGSVTENCIERCLICLDDYDNDEDLRIMNCKHMFHKGCVDRWMETGRNNCPACRTKGVDTAPPPESSPTTVS
ncbi:unnamed protein product [Rhizoctonia solani]|uniref:RING-type E3 ubiquitin transferase n=1 Tax=Rhizoctonia solani TaxID=456999 RepID=A0A8H2Y577_9AGAM|nr:unnamed protein product [Rhizoctonia solani]